MVSADHERRKIIKTNDGKTNFILRIWLISFIVS